MHLKDAKSWVRLAQKKSRRGHISSRTFSSLFGNPAVVLPALWGYVAIAFVSQELSPFHLLWFLYWIKLYDPLDACASFWHTDKDTFGERCRSVLFVLHESLPAVRFSLLFMA